MCVTARFTGVRDYCCFYVFVLLCVIECKSCLLRIALSWIFLVSETAQWLKHLSGNRDTAKNLITLGQHSIIVSCFCMRYRSSFWKFLQDHTQITNNCTVTYTSWRKWLFHMLKWCTWSTKDLIQIPASILNDSQLPEASKSTELMPSSDISN